MTRTSIGSYKVTRRLETEGEVYLARSVTGARCHVQIVEHPGEEIWEDARRQAALCAGLDHPAIGKLLDGFEEDGKLAVVTEPIDGVTLDQLLERVASDGGSVDPQAVWHIGHQLAGALSQAHAANDDDVLAVCHGHLAPSRIAVAWNGFVRLDGLGLSPLVNAGSLTAPAAFTAPEQRAAGSRITPRGDIYSLGAVLWALLAGSTPPDDPSVDDLGVNLPASFHEAFVRALEAKLGKRFLTALELEQLLGDMTTPAGKSALAKAVAVLRRGGSLLTDPVAARRGGISRPGPSRPGASRPGASGPGASGPGASGPGATAGASGGRGSGLGAGLGSGAGRPGGLRKRSSTPSMRKVPQRQATLLGVAVPPPRQKLESRPPAIDWEAASEAVKRPSQPPGLPEDVSWDDDAPTRMIEQAAIPRPAVPRIPEPEDDPNEGDRLSAEEIADAIAMADRAVEELSESNRARDEEVEQVDDVDDDIDILAAAVVSPSRDDDEPDPDSLPRPAPSKPESSPPPLAAASKPEPSPPPLAAASKPEPSPPPLAAASKPEEPPPVASKPESSPPGAASEPAPAAEVPRPLPEAGSGGSAVGAEQSPWAGESLAPSSLEPLSWGKAIGITVVTAAVTMAIGVWWVRSNAVPAPPPEGGQPAASLAAAEPKPAPKPAPKAKAKPTPAPTASASAAPAGDGSELPANKGYLLVHFEGAPDAEVFFRLTSQGKVNEKLVVDCTEPQFVRIGRGQPTLWLSDGRPGVQIACQSVTEITMRRPIP